MFSTISPIKHIFQPYFFVVMIFFGPQYAKKKGLPLQAIKISVSHKRFKIFPAYLSNFASHHFVMARNRKPKLKSKIVTECYIAELRQRPIFLETQARPPEIAILSDIWSPNFMQSVGNQAFRLKSDCSSLSYPLFI